MGLWSWLTGRDEKQQDVYANYERVDDLVANLKKVSTTEYPPPVMQFQRQLQNLKMLMVWPNLLDK